MECYCYSVTTLYGHTCDDKNAISRMHCMGVLMCDVTIMIVITVITTTTMIIIITTITLLLLANNRIINK